jgi:hypothetical protein
MNKGILIYAHNSRNLDYLDLALISGRLAKKNLKVSVSLVTDRSTIEWSEKSNKLTSVNEIFDQIILSDDYVHGYHRRLYDGINHKEEIPFLNKDRCSAWDLTPYDQTLLIDSDFLIMSEALNEYWSIDSDFIIAEGANDLNFESRLEYNDRYISEVGIEMRWATTIMFKKTEFSKKIFDTVKFVRENYSYFGDLYRFDYRTFRNDIAFSVANHILNGQMNLHQYFLPCISTSIDKDILIDVKKDRLFFLISSKYENSYVPCSNSGHDIHVMNKQSLIRNKEKLLEL